MDAQAPASGGEPPDADGVVEVLGLLAVDGHGRPVPKIPAPLERGGGDGGRDGRGFPRGVLGEFGPEPVATDDHLGVDPRVLGLAENPRDGQGRPVGLDDHPRGGLEPAARLERDVVLRKGVERLEEGSAAPLAVDPQKHGPALPEDALDPSFGLAELAPLVDDDGHLVPRHGAQGVPGGDEDVLAAALRRDEAETGTGGDESAADKPGLFGEQETAAEGTDLAPGFELADFLEELGPVPTLDAELSQDLVERQALLVLLEEGEDLDGGHGAFSQ